MDPASLNQTESSFVKKLQWNWSLPLTNSLTSGRMYRALTVLLIALDLRAFFDNTCSGQQSHWSASDSSCQSTAMEKSDLSAAQLKYSPVIHLPDGAFRKKRNPTPDAEVGTFSTWKNNSRQHKGQPVGPLKMWNLIRLSLRRCMTLELCRTLVLKFPAFLVQITSELFLNTLIVFSRVLRRLGGWVLPWQGQEVHIEGSCMNHSSFYKSHWDISCSVIKFLKIQTWFGYQYSCV